MTAFEDGAHDDPQVRLDGPLAKLALMVEWDWWRATKDPDPRVREFVGIVNAVATPGAGDQAPRGARPRLDEDEGTEPAQRAVVDRVRGGVLAVVREHDARVRAARREPTRGRSRGSGREADRSQSRESAENASCGRERRGSAGVRRERGEHAGAPDPHVRAWIELVRRLGRDGTRTGPRRRSAEEYAPALAMAREVEAIVNVAQGQGMGAAADRATETGGDEAGGDEGTRIGGDEAGGDDATGIGGVAARIAQHVLAQGATGNIMVAIRDDINRRFPFPEPDYIMVRPELSAAADYVLATVVLPKKYGHRSAVEHDCFICQNARCRRRTLRLHPHHIDERRFGVNHHPSNIVGLCPGCHLRGIHSAWMLVKRIGDWLVWAYADGGVAIMYSPVEWVVARVERTRAA